MKLFALSDLHLNGPDDPFYGRTISWIKNHVKSEDILVLAGDIFDLYVGKKDYFEERYREFHELLNQLLANGVSIYYIEGNHDFRLNGVFPNALRIYTNEVKVTLGNQQVFIAHGDLVDREDYGYRALRSFFRSVPFSLFIDHAPDSWIRSIGEKLSHESQNLQGKRRLRADREASRQERTRRIYRSAAAEKISEGVDFVIMGHCHLIDEFRIQVGNRSGHYMNMGYPKTHESGIVIDSTTGQMSRLKIE